MTDIRQLVRRSAVGVLAAYRRAKRARLAMPVLGNTKSPATIYFFLPDFDRIAGGILAIYRHVDILNAGGIPAFVLHQRKGFRCTWFENDTRIAYIGSTTLSSSDLLVVCELDVDLISRMPSGIRFVIFNQSGHMTWLPGAAHVARHYNSNPALMGVVVVSDHSRELLSYAFPHLRLYRIHLGIDPSRFHPSESARARRICYMPRRGREDAELVLNLLAQRRTLGDWTVKPLDRLPHVEVGQLLRTSRLFLSFSYQEGFGLPVAEAMACGNYVIGYHAYGGRELFRPDFSAAIEPGDVLGFCRAIEQAVTNDRFDETWCLKRGVAASRFVLENYSIARERTDVLDTYAKLLTA